MKELCSWLYRITASAVVLLFVAGAVHAQGGDVTITGRVTAETGAPLAAVNVFIGGMSLGTQTGEDGRYSFVVGANRASGQPVTLQVRVIGYSAKSAQITLTQGQTLVQDFVLTANPLRLDDVIVTGAGTTTTRERLANVINSVDSSLIRRSNEPQNVVAALAGKVPNLDVRMQSGDPGSSASVKIRGNASLSGTNQPLFVVDGQPIDNRTISTNQTAPAFPGSSSSVTQNRVADINPADIESIEVLKGSAAAAIYGARAANGVVLITTKRGRPGPTQVSFTSTTMWDNVIKTMPLQRQYAHGMDGVTYSCPGIDCFSAARGAWGALIPTGTATYDHAKEIFDTGLTLDNNLSISGGNDRTTFYGSGGLVRQEGMMVGPNNRYNRLSVRLKATHQATDRLNIGGNFNYVDTRGRYVQKGNNLSGPLLGALRTPPDFDNQPYLDPLSGRHRSFRFQQPSVGSLTQSRGYDNPFFAAYNPGNRSELGRMVSNVNADWEPLDWLSVRYTLGGDFYNDWRLESFPFTSSEYANGHVIRNDINNLEIDHNLIAVAKHRFNDIIGGEFTVGQNLNSRRFRMNANLGRNLIAEEPFALQNTLVITPNEYRELQHIEAYFAQAAFDFYDQVYLTLGLRNDGFSTFGSSKRRHNFPKASLAWNFTDALGDIDPSGIVSYGKLRVAYGETGKSPENAYAALSAYSLTNQFGSGFGDLLNTSQGGQAGLSSSLLLGNPNLRPERSRESEYGIDLALLDQRVDLGFTYYYKRTNDIILGSPINASANGASSQIRNGAAMKNEGIELTFNARPITQPNITWDIGLNFGRNRNTVTSLDGAQFITWNTEGLGGAVGSAVLGLPAGVLRGLDFVRCRTATENGVSCDPNANPSDLYIAANGFPVIDPTQRTIADPNPKYTMGFNTSMKLFNKFTIATMLDMRRGFTVWNGTSGILKALGTHERTLVRNQTGKTVADWYQGVYPGFSGPGKNVVVFNSPEDWQNWLMGEGAGFGNTTVQSVEDGSFIKWRELSVTYTVAQRWLQRSGFRNADVRIAGRNLHTWTRYTGLDPEINLGGAEWLSQGVDYFTNPLTRSFVFSISLNR